MIYDLIIVGGGLAGSAVATAMARTGATVLVLEHEHQFRDRVRGEGMHPWGVAETRSLGLYEPLLATCALEVPGWTNVFAGAPPRRRDRPRTNPHGAGSLTYHHPEMQETLLHLAEDAGARVRRGARVIGVQPGMRPTVTVQLDGRTGTIATRLVVGADGRGSGVRGWAGFPVHRDPARSLVSGVLFSGLTAAPDSVHLFFPPGMGFYSILFPVGRGRVRAYFITDRRTVHRRLSGAGDVSTFIERSIATGVPPAWYAQATAIGRLATFEGAAHWVERPYREGVALVGDAAGASDPTYGCGQSLAVRGARLLRDALLADDDWEVAGMRYAAAHDQMWTVVHTVEGWMEEIFFRPGPEGERLRTHALAVMASGQGPDIVGVGPDACVDETMCDRLFGAEPVRLTASALT